MNKNKVVCVCERKTGNVTVCVWQTTLTSKKTSNLPDPPLKADHKSTGNGQFHERAPLLQTVSGPSCRTLHTDRLG